MNEHTIVRRNEKVLHNMVDDEVVMLLPDLNQYMAMNGTGSVIWELLAGKISIGTIVRELTNDYEIDKEICEKEVMGYLKRLVEKDLVEIYN